RPRLFLLSFPTRRSSDLVVKHAHASTVVVTLGIFADALTIDIVDDGVGMNTADASNSTSSSSFGLSGLQQRIASLGGTMSVESPPNGGTALAARLPLTSEREDRDEH